MSKLATLKALLQEFMYEIDTATLDITETTKFVDLGMDSLDQLEFVMAVEDEYSIEIDDEQADTITCIADILALPQLADK